MADPSQDFQLQLFNTLTGKLDPFVPLDPAGKKVKMYVCGPTVYDDAHLGHARCYITWDVLYRFLKFLGYDVKYVRNVTDVDDKILNRAKERGEAPADLAERNYQSFSADMKALNVLPLPKEQEPRATEYIPQMLEGIQTLIDKGAAYPTADGSVYFRVSAKADYGKLKFGTNNPEALKKHLDDLKSGARVEVDEEKESPLDFALWKAVPASDPYGWESPWPSKETGKGWGRPGWHMECSAMNQSVFGDQIDIHAGGADLIFPHHENEIAQSEAWSGHQPFAKYWLHNGFVNVSGEKMSKSLGNFSTIKKLLERYDANTIRYFLLTAGYRKPVDFNETSLNSAEARVSEIHETVKQACDKLGFIQLDIEKMELKPDFEALEKFRLTALNDIVVSYDSAFLFLAQDLNTAGALGKLSALQGRLESYNRKLFEDVFGESFAGSDVTNAEAYKLVLHLLVHLLSVIGFNASLAFVPKVVTVAETELALLQNLIQSRKSAKAEKNWTEADRLRGEVLAQGYQILDNKDGTTSVEKDGVEILRV